MLHYENQIIEFNQEYTPELRKEVLAFVNADGGTVFVGVKKDGTVIGVNDPDGVMLQIANSLKDALPEWHSLLILSRVRLRPPSAPLTGSPCCAME